LLHLVEKRLDSSGRLMVSSQRTRDQSRNLADARRKVHDWIALALRKPKKRIATQPGPASRDRRLQEKKRTSARKAGRQLSPAEFED
jgi:ribosome-associated protein